MSAKQEPALFELGVGDEVREHYHALMLSTATRIRYHRDYGPCDALGNDGACSACDSLFDDIQIAIAMIAGGFESDDPNELAERHPAAAAALRVLLPYATDETKQVISRQKGS